MHVCESNIHNCVKNQLFVDRPDERARIKGIQPLGLWFIRGPESAGFRLVDALSYIKLGGPLLKNDTNRSHIT